MIQTRSALAWNSGTTSSTVLRFVKHAAFAILLTATGLVAVDQTPRAAAGSAFASSDIPGNLTSVTPGDRLARRASFSFDLVRSAGAAACLPNARGEVTISQRAQGEQMDVTVSGLPADTTFTVFVLQLPHAPFGLAWYQGDVRTNDEGEGHARFLGIFSDETFIVAPGTGAAPAVHAADAIANPATPPIHTFHLGMWFDATADAVAAGCAANQTPFNGDHTAGIQVLNTTNFPDGDGPIGQFGR